MSEWISWQNQQLIIEKIYRSTDAITSTKKFNEEYSDKIGKVGEAEMLLNDFGRKLRATGLDTFYLERYIKEVTGKDLNLEAL